MKLSISTSYKNLHLKRKSLKRYAKQKERLKRTHYHPTKIYNTDRSGEMF